MASTDSSFLTLGHGSPPKISGVMGTVQDCWPTQVCRGEQGKWEVQNQAQETSLGDEQVTMRCISYLVVNAVGMERVAASLSEAAKGALWCAVGIFD